MSEHDEQYKLFLWTRYRPELKWMFAIPNGGIRDRITAARMKQEGVKSGVWDIFFCPYHRKVTMVYLLR